MPSRLFRLIRQMLRRGRLHEDASVMRQRRVIAQARRDVLTALAVLPPDSFRAGQLAALLDALDRVLTPRATEAVRIGGEDARTAFALGVAQAEATITVPAVPTVGLTSQLIAAIVEVTETQLRAVWAELGEGLRGAVRRVALGAQTPDDAMAAVARLIRTPKTFGTTETRAEVIVRTETNRAYNVAADARFRELDAVFDGQLRKAWIATGDDRTRRTHRAAGEQYDAAGAIPISETFRVGTARLRYPLDPLGPAREVIACRCRMIAIPPEITEAEWATTIEELRRVEEASA